MATSADYTSTPSSEVATPDSGAEQGVPGPSASLQPDLVNAWHLSESQVASEEPDGQAATAAAAAPAASAEPTGPHKPNLDQHVALSPSEVRSWIFALLRDSSCSE